MGNSGAVRDVLETGLDVQGRQSVDGSTTPDYADSLSPPQHEDLSVTAGDGRALGGDLGGCIEGTCCRAPWPLVVRA